MPSNSPEYNQKYFHCKTGRARKMVNDARRRAKKKGLAFDIDLEYTLSIMEDACPIFKKEFDYTGGRGKWSPSLDRKVPELGYVKGNVQVVSKLANGMMQDATDDELHQFALWVMRTDVLWKKRGKPDLLWCGQPIFLPDPETVELSLEVGAWNEGKLSS
jgi:hypothetical protein